MLSPAMVLAVGRAVERVLADSMFGVSLILGWNLFRVGVLQDQTAELSSKGWKIRLQKVGPGVFFALFGAVGLIVALQKPLQIDSNSDGRGGLTEPGNNVHIRDLGADKSVSDYIVALNTVENLGIRDDGTHSAEKDALAEAKPILEQYRVALLQSFYKGDYKWYVNLRNGNPLAIEQLSTAKRARYDEIDRTATRTFATNALR